MQEKLENKKCTIKNINVALITRGTYAPSGFGHQDVPKWIPGQSYCSASSNCEEGCKWAVGQGESKIDPMTAR